MLDRSTTIVLASSETGAPEVPLGVTLLFLGLLVAMILTLALEEKLHAKKSLIVGVYATITLLLGAFLLPLEFGPVHVGDHDVHMPVYIPAIDWGVLSIIVGSALFVDATSRSGLFSWIAIKLTKLSQGDPVKLLWFYGLMTVVFSAVLNNVTAMIIVGSLSAVSLKKLERESLLLGFLIIEGLLTNVGGLLTLISSVPNIIVGTTAGISFVEFFIKASPYVVVTTIITILMGAKIFGIKSLRDPDARAQADQLIQSFDERDGISSPSFFWFGVIMLALFILVIATTSVLPGVSDLGMGFVALAFAAIMLLRFKHDVDQFYRVIDWDLLGFFAALFVVIGVMEEAEVLTLIGHGLERLLGLGDASGPAALLVSSAAASSVTDNIPLAAMLAKILGGIEGIAGDGSSPFWWAVILGANLGGNITPIGSASTLVAVTIIHRHGLKLSFFDFVKRALPFAMVQLALAVLYLLLCIPLFG